MTPADLESLVTTLRRLGVRQYTDGGVSLTLDAAPLAMNIPTTATCN